MGKLLKSGDVLMCEVTSRDLWLAIRLEVPSIGTVLHCEMKMDRETTVDSLRLCLFHYALELLKLSDSSSSYSPQDLQLTQNTALTRRLSITTPSQTQIGGQPLESDWKVGQCFDFITCYVSGLLTPRTGIQTWESRNRFSDEIKKTPVIRKVRIEELTAASKSLPPAKPTQAQSQCVGCFLY